MAAKQKLAIDGGKKVYNGTFPAWPSFEESTVQAAADVLRSGKVNYWTGKIGMQFEKEWAKWLGVKNAISVANGTCALHTALAGMNIGPGDEVITPSMTWVSLPNTVLLFGATPVFADVDRDTLMVTPEAIEEKITPKTRLIVPVHFAGAALNMGPIRKIAEKHNIMLVEDAAHALGSEWNGERIGSRGTCMFSFHPIKNITTGEGGMFTTDDPQLAGKVRSLKFHGLGVDAYDRQTHGRAPQAQVVEPGFKFNMPDMQAVLGVRQLARINEFNAKREALALRYREKFADIDEILPLKDPDYRMKHSWHLFVVRVTDKAGVSRDEFMSELKKRNIGTGLHFRCTHLQKYYRDVLGYKPGMFPNTEWNSDRICSIPLFPDMTEKDQDDVIDAIKDILARR